MISQAESDEQKREYERQLLISQDKIRRFNEKKAVIMDVLQMGTQIGLAAMTGGGSAAGSVAGQVAQGAAAGATAPSPSTNQMVQQNGYGLGFTQQYGGMVGEPQYSLPGITPRLWANPEYTDPMYNLPTLQEPTMGGMSVVDTPNQVSLRPYTGVQNRPSLNTIGETSAFDDPGI